MEGNTFTLTTPSPKLDTADQILPHLNPLQESTTVTTIKLSGNTLGAPACSALASVLSTKSTLQTANLADIFTSRLLSEIPPALSSLLTSLLPLQNLHTVDLSDNAFGLNTQAPLVDFLSQHVPLQHLILNNNGLGPDAGTLIADALTTLAAKKEDARRKDPEGAVPHLETIVCGRNRLESGSMPAWAKCFRAHSRGVRVVKMVQNGIRQDGVALLLREGLGRCEGLEVCDLQDNTFTTVGARALAEVVGGWGKLQELGVGDCLVGARGMVALAEALGAGKNGGLRVLRAQYNEIDAKGVKALLEVVKQGKLEGLRRVEINGNKFSEDDESVEGLRSLLEERKENSQEVDEGEWGLDELSDLEEDSDEEDEDESDEEAEEDEDDEEREGKAQKILDDADQEENSKVSQKKDAEVDDLADQLGKTELK
ncbi:MAG: Ran GTPase-activating protein 1 [Heterodermia speciosa]|uniref:Ran GTPase-activating protein 1 n=1 Tax=Heterodermia speciosa TaxID=116794 RepID=A0A8H3EL99_9LECA|nr:MAG: Ran GTPase-activating protein 1 [Heterodermia speciosa]